MLFNSLNFVLFFPVVTILYFLIPHKVRWLWLLLANYYFYMSWSPRYAILMTVSIVITYMSGVLISRSSAIDDEERRVFQRKLWVGLSFGSNLLILFFFKYFYFALDNINYVLTLTGHDVLNSPVDILLPVGISFYTFQALSYTMDVYRNEIAAEKNIMKYALFVSFFPQLVAGPIERSKNLLSQMSEKHTFDYDRVKNGLILMFWGFFLKLAVADRVCEIVDEVYNNYLDYSGIQIIIATILFALQIYCDFSGYSNISKGAGQVLGFRLMDNFKQPYFAMSVQEFWHRWHISLSTWFRDYLYIPLGGSRCSRVKKQRNIMITFILSGLWHGASWNFIAWGTIHGLYQVIGNIIKPVRERTLKTLNVDTSVFSHKLLKGFITFVLVDFAWIFFRAADMSTAIGIIRQMISSPFSGAVSKTMQMFFNAGWGKMNMLFALVALSSFFALEVMQYKMDVFARLGAQNLWFRWLIYMALIFGVLFTAIAFANIAGQAFIYFRF